MDLKVSMEASAVAAVADGACTENEQSVHMAATRLRVSGAIGTMPLEAVSNLLQAAKVGGRGREHAVPATNEQKLKNARLNAATSRCSLRTSPLCDGNTRALGVCPLSSSWSLTPLARHTNSERNHQAGADHLPGPPLIYGQGLGSRRVDSVR